MIKTTDIALWEIMKDGKDEEVYEVTECVLKQYIGHQVKVKEGITHSRATKCLVDPKAKIYDESALSTLYGCLGTAKFRLVQQYEEIDYVEALELLSVNRIVHYFNDGKYLPLSRYTDFAELYLRDFADLMSETFYKKGAE